MAEIDCALLAMILFISVLDKSFCEHNSQSKQALFIWLGIKSLKCT